MSTRDAGIHGGSPLARSRRSRQRAEADRCPKCGRKSALRIEVVFHEVWQVCRWSGCGYESGPAA